MSKYNKTQYILIYLVVVFAINVRAQIPSNNSKGYTYVYSFKKGKDGLSLGMVYVKWIDKSTFTSLIIVKEKSGIKDTIYCLINKNEFYIKNHKKDPYAPPVTTDKFYGYKFLLKKDDYVEIQLAQSQGKIVSDPIDIMWNYELKRFGVPYTP